MALHSKHGLFSPGSQLFSYEIGGILITQPISLQILETFILKCRPSSCEAWPIFTRPLQTITCQVSACKWYFWLLLLETFYWAWVKEKRVCNSVKYQVFFNTSFTHGVNALAQPSWPNGYGIGLLSLEGLRVRVPPGVQLFCQKEIFANSGESNKGFLSRRSASSIDLLSQQFSSFSSLSWNYIKKILIKKC